MLEPGDRMVRLGGVVSVGLVPVPDPPEPVPVPLPVPRARAASAAGSRAASGAGAGSRAGWRGNKARGGAVNGLDGGDIAGGKTRGESVIGVHDVAALIGVDRKS